MKDIYVKNITQLLLILAISSNYFLFDNSKFYIALSVMFVGVGYIFSKFIFKYCERSTLEILLTLTLISLCLNVIGKELYQHSVFTKINMNYSILVSIFALILTVITGIIFIVFKDGLKEISSSTEFYKNKHDLLQVSMNRLEEKINLIDRNSKKLNFMYRNPVETEIESPVLPILELLHEIITSLPFSSKEETEFLSCLSDSLRLNQLNSRMRYLQSDDYSEISYALSGISTYGNVKDTKLIEYLKKFQQNTLSSDPINNSSGIADKIDLTIKGLTNKD